MRRWTCDVLLEVPLERLELVVNGVLRLVLPRVRQKGGGTEGRRVQRRVTPRQRMRRQRQRIDAVIVVLLLPAVSVAANLSGGVGRPPTPLPPPPPPPPRPLGGWAAEGEGGGVCGCPGTVGVEEGVDEGGAEGGVLGGQPRLSQLLVVRHVPLRVAGRGGGSGGHRTCAERGGRERGGGGEGGGSLRLLRPPHPACVCAVQVAESDAGGGRLLHWGGGLR